MRKPKHGHTGDWGKSPTYRSWQNMWARCTQPSNPAFQHYSRRGITVCEHWRDFRVFLADMGVRPDRATLERIDNNAGYSRENCRWATRREQANNRITNLRFEYQGCVYSLADLARKVGVDRELLRSRLVRGKGGPWTVEAAVAAPRRRGHRTDRLGPMVP